MTQLYVLANNYLALAERLAEGDFDATTIADTVEASGITDELAVKAQGIEHVARAAEAHNLAIDAEIARLQALKARRQRVAQGLRDYLHENMLRMGMDKIECSLFSLSIKKNPPAVDVFDPLSLPKEYWRTPEPKPPIPVPDKKALLDVLKDGQAVPGVRLTQGTRLEVK